jgi:hypothetical protein
MHASSASPSLHDLIHCFTPLLPQTSGLMKRQDSLHAESKSRNTEKLSYRDGIFLKFGNFWLTFFGVLPVA